MLSRTNKGFTLIELLVVIVLLGVVTSIAVLSIGTTSAERKMEEEAKRLHSLIKLVQEEAIIQAKEIAIDINKNKYTFFEYKEKKWLPLANRIFRKRNIDDALDISVSTESQPTFFESKDTGLTRLYFLSSGEQTPFEIKLNVKQQARPYYLLTGQFNGKLEVKKVDAL